jgi:DNA (cytosine-5)-methyltransferase 1
MTLKVASLFSGIGGMDLGLEATGHFKTILFSENNEFCQKILKKHWPDVPIIKDVRSINGKEIETDVLIGGFPCQPFSVAGKRKGKEDERHLWPEMFRIIKEARPSIVIGENVPGIINTQMALGQCVIDLESEGYKVQPVVLPACGVNAPHRRYRVFIIAMANADTGFDFRKNKKIQAGRNASDSSGKNVADSISRDVEAGRERQRKICEGYKSKGISDNASGGSEIKRFTDNWSIEPNVGRLAHGVSDRVAKLKALGNAVVPQLMYVIGMSIVRVMQDD